MKERIVSLYGESEEINKLAEKVEYVTFVSKLMGYDIDIHDIDDNIMGVFHVFIMRQGEVEAFIKFYRGSIVFIFHHRFFDYSIKDNRALDTFDEILQYL